MIKTTRFDPVDYLQDEQDIAIYLEEMMLERGINVDHSTITL